MINFKRVGLVFVVAALAGCTEATPVVEAPANEPASTTAPAPAKSVEVATAEPVQDAAPVPEVVVEPPGAAAPSLVIQHMPADCDEARLYINTSRIISPEIETALDGMVTSLMSEATKSDKSDAKKAQATLKALRDGGLDPLKSLDEIALCANADDTKSVIALAFDMSKAKKPADVIAKAMTAATGKKPQRAEVDGVSYLQAKAEGPWLAVVGQDRLVLGDTKDAAILAVKGGNNGDRGFANATRNVLWVKADKARRNQSIEVNVREVGEAFHLRVKAELGNDASKAAGEFEKARPQLDKIAQKMPALSHLLPAVKGARVSASNGLLSVAAEVSKREFGQFVNALQGQGLQDLMRNF